LNRIFPCNVFILPNRWRRDQNAADVDCCHYADLQTLIPTFVIKIGPAPAALTVSVRVLESAPRALVAVNVIDPLAVAVGVPDSTPALLNVIPAGSVPLVTVQVIGAVPLAVNVVDG
jgi:hypothetical protein